MTYKDTAEKYVRSQIPELTEVLTSYSDERYPEGLEETISLPIQLQHWLRVLEHSNWNYEVEIKVNGDGADVWIKNDGNMDTSKSFDKYIRFDLTTGQPATEADYQAFNEIVGITSEDKKDV